jgi:two-component sensor histidine kinase
MAETDRHRIAELEAEAARLSTRLREVDHRIKNDLQLLNSVFVLQLRKAAEGVERETVRGALERVGAVSAVHRRLDVTDDPAQFEASALVRDLVEEAVGAARRADLAVDMQLSPVSVPTRQAAPLALIVGELVRNALKHAFPGRTGRIEVTFGPAEGGVELRVRDDGVGLPQGLAAPRGFGGTLVGLLAQQLRGEVEIGPASPGVVATVRFPRGD